MDQRNDDDDYNDQADRDYFDDMQPLIDELLRDRTIQRGVDFKIDLYPVEVGILKAMVRFRNGHLEHQSRVLSRLIRHWCITFWVPIPDFDSRTELGRRMLRAFHPHVYRTTSYIAAGFYEELHEMVMTYVRRPLVQHAGETTQAETEQICSENLSDNEWRAFSVATRAVLRSHVHEENMPEPNNPVMVRSLVVNSIIQPYLGPSVAPRMDPDYYPLNPS